MAAKGEGNPLCDGTPFGVQQEARRAERYVRNSNNDPDSCAHPGYELPLWHNSPHVIASAAKQSIVRQAER